MRSMVLTEIQQQRPINTIKVNDCVSSEIETLQLRMAVMVEQTIRGMLENISGFARVRSQHCQVPPIVQAR